MTMTAFRKVALALSLGATAITGVAATPAVAHDRYYEYRPGDYYRGYDRDDYRDYDRGGYYRGDDRGYYRDTRYYRGRDHYRYRCRNDGTGGTIVGAIAGGLIGNGLSGYGDRTTGTVLGAAVGALAGHAIDKGDGRC